MRFYTGQHRYYCGIDLHARTMYLCILDHESDKIVLGHALYMKAIHGGKPKNDKIDDPETLELLQTIPGVGRILALTLLYDLHDVTRFPRVQDFSAARLGRTTRS